MRNDFSNSMSYALSISFGEYLTSAINAIISKTKKHANGTIIFTNPGYLFPLIKWYKKHNIVVIKAIQKLTAILIKTVSRVGLIYQAFLLYL